jgi:hypothetical protein
MPQTPWRGDTQLEEQIRGGQDYQDAYPHSYNWGSRGVVVFLPFLE